MFSVSRILMVVAICSGAAACGTDDSLEGVCERACEESIACKEQGFPDSDLEELTLSSCMSGCVAGGAEATEVERRAYLDCIDNASDCMYLDEVCDIF